MRLESDLAQSRFRLDGRAKYGLPFFEGEGRRQDCGIASADPKIAQRAVRSGAAERNRQFLPDGIARSDDELRLDVSVQCRAGVDIRASTKWALLTALRMAGACTYRRRCP